MPAKVLSDRVLTGIGTSVEAAIVRAVVGISSRSEFSDRVTEPPGPMTSPTRPGV
jgi:hypothetical protein